MNHSGHSEPSKPLNVIATVALIERSILLLFVLGILIGVVEVLRPFTTAILFGSALAISSWPLRRAMTEFGMKAGAAAAVLLLLSLAVIVFPVVLLAPVLTDQLAIGIGHVRDYFATTPQRPSWLGELPLIGSRATLVWDEAVRAGGRLSIVLAPYAETARQTLMLAAQALAASIVQIALSLVVAMMFWVNGEGLVAVLNEMARRLGGETAYQALQAAVGAVRGVAYGVVGTALIQTVLLELGLLAAGVPWGAMLGFVALMLAISQIGAPLLLLIAGAAAWWLFATDDHAWGIFMLIWGLMVGTIDNFIRPWLIGFGVRMPLSLTVLGVFGGFLAFGFLGLFIGPMLIAIAFTLLQAWRAVPPEGGV